MNDLDATDQAIITELRKNGRLPVTELASRVNLTKTPCQLRLQKLEAKGYILGYAARIDHKKLDEGHIAFVQVSLSDTRSAALEAFNQAVRSVPEIEQCHMIASDFDYFLKVRTADMAAYRQALGETISALPHVRHTSTFVVMESVKEF
jgi:Lrp/AsnC family leucine-responsive transcriptional regulator